MESVAYVNNDDGDDGYHTAKDLIRSDDDFLEPPQMQFFALQRLYGYFAIRACDMGRYYSPWMVWSLFGTLATLLLCIARTLSDIAEGPIHVLLEFGTLTLTLISRCAPFVDGLLLSAAIVDKLLLSAAIVQHHDTGLSLVRSVPRCIPAHNCDTSDHASTMAFLDLCIGSTRWSLLCSRKRCVSQSQFAAAVSRPDG